MTKLNSPESSLPSSRTSRTRILVVLGGIGLSALSYECGRGVRDEVASQSQVDAHANDEALRKSQESADQCRTALKAITQKKRILSRWLDIINKQLSYKKMPENPDEGTLLQCIDITDKAFDKLSSDLAYMLSITNPDDIDKIFRAMKRGYTRLDSISEDGKHISLTDPNFDPENDQGMNSSAYLDLEKPIEDIPDEFKPDKIPKTDEELAMAEQIASSQFEDIITNFDLGAIQSPGAAEKIVHNNLIDLQSKLSETDEPEQRRDLFCSFFGAIMQQDLDEIENPDEETPPTEYTPEDMKNLRLIDLYMEAVMKSLGLKDEEECLKYILNRPPCDCSANDEGD